MKYLRSIALFVSFIGINAATAQCECEANFENGWCWGTQPDLAKEKNALYTDAYKTKDFLKAEEGLKWLLENAPCLNKSLYQNASKIYFGLAATTKGDGAKQLEYSEMALQMYDKRIEMFGQEATVMNYKADAAYKLMRGRKSKYEELLKIFERSFELNGNKFFDGNMVAYMDLLRRYKEAGNELRDDKVFEIYFALQDVIDYRAKINKPVSDKTKDSIEALLLQIVPNIDCDIVISDFGPKLESNPDINLAKKIFKLMLTGKCADDPLALNAAKIVDDAEPSYGIKLFIGGRNQAEGNDSEAIQYFTDAIELTDENTKKADLYLKIARVKRKQGSKSQAREYANKALGVDPSMKEAYVLIGDLYLASSDECARKKDAADRVRDRLIFIAARDAYKKGGNAQKAAEAKKLFPSKEEIFNANIFTVGQTISTGCWVNKTVVLETRD